MPRNEEHHEKLRELQSHPAVIEHLEVESFGRSLIEVWQGNWRELANILSGVANDQNLIVQMATVDSDMLRLQLWAELSRRLHNYLAATMTVVDHSRRLMDARTGPTTLEFRNRLAAVTLEPEMRFVQELRNYTLHRKLPAPGHRMTMTRQPDGTFAETSELQLGTKELLDWDGWSTGSRRILEGDGDTIDIRHPLEWHAAIFFDLNSWLYRALASDNAEGLEVANRLVEEVNMALTGGGTLEEVRSMMARRQSGIHEMMRDDVPVRPSDVTGENGL